jgi:hypothetical protein
MNDATRCIIGALRNRPVASVTPVPRRQVSDSHPVFNPLPINREMELCVALYLNSKSDAEVLALHVLMSDLEG